MLARDRHGRREQDAQDGRAAIAHLRQPHQPDIARSQAGADEDGEEQQGGEIELCPDGQPGDHCTHCRGGRHPEREGRPAKSPAGEHSRFRGNCFWLDVHAVHRITAP